MTLLSVFTDQIKELVNEMTNDVDAKAIIRRKPFILLENNEVERIVHLDIDGDLSSLKSGTFNTKVRNDRNVVASFRLKQPIFDTFTIPYVGDVVFGTHLDISTDTQNFRVKIDRVNKDRILIVKSVSIPMGSMIRVMDLQRSNTFVRETCRCCGDMKSVPLFHGKPGYCRECNLNIIRPLKNKIYSYLKGLLESGMYYREDHFPRSFQANQIDGHFRDDQKRFFINVNGESIRARIDKDTGIYTEIIDKKRFVGTKADYNGVNYSIDGKTYNIAIEPWAQGLSNKIKELRIDKSESTESIQFDGTFINDDCHGDQTILHMRRMYNVAVSLRMMDMGIRDKNDAIECIEKSEMILNQPDCSRRLHSMILIKLTNAAEKFDIISNMGDEFSQKLMGMLVALHEGLANTSVSHEEN